MRPTRVLGPSCHHSWGQLYKRVLGWGQFCPQFVQVVGKEIKGWAHKTLGYVIASCLGRKMGCYPHFAGCPWASNDFSNSLNKGFWHWWEHNPAVLNAMVNLRAWTGVFGQWGRRLQSENKQTNKQAKTPLLRWIFAVLTGGCTRRPCSLGWNLRTTASKLATGRNPRLHWHFF